MKAIVGLVLVAYLVALGAFVYHQAISPVELGEGFVCQGEHYRLAFTPALELSPSALPGGRLAFRITYADQPPKEAVVNLYVSTDPDNRSRLKTVEGVVLQPTTVIVKRPIHFFRVGGARTVPREEPSVTYGTMDVTDLSYGSYYLHILGSSGCSRFQLSLWRGSYPALVLSLGISGAGATVGSMLLLAVFIEALKRPRKRRPPPFLRDRLFL